jgi:hypothetical protein
MKQHPGKLVALTLFLMVLVALALLLAVPGVLAIHTIVLPPGN